MSAADRWAQLALALMLWWCLLMATAPWADAAYQFGKWLRALLTPH